MKLSRATRVALAVLAALLLGSVVAPALVPWLPEQIDWNHVAAAPGTAGHWLGTDRLGRDLLVRCAAGVRISLLIALAATVVSLVIGVGVGAIAGYAGGRTDALLMRAVDVLYSLPYVFFVILLTVVFGRRPTTVFIAIGAVGWLTMARVVRGEARRLREREFIEAAIATGLPSLTILRRHVLPNLAGPVLVYATLTVPGMILIESFLSFLGLGIQEPAASLGNLLAAGAADMESAPWLLLAPVSCLVAMVLALGIVGEGLRDALDPHAR